MEVIDKRKENKDEEWKVGDVVCYYNDKKESANYGLIVGPTGENEYYIAFLDDDAIRGLSIDGGFPEPNVSGTSSVNELISILKSNWKYVEKVNAKPVIE